MATRIVSGILREVWQSDAPLDGGVFEAISTGIACSTAKLSQVQAFVTLDQVVNAPSISGALSVVAGKLVVTVTNAAVAGNTATWSLDVALNHSIMQARGSMPALVWTRVGAAAAITALVRKVDKAKTIRTVTAATDTILATDNAALGRLLVICTNAVGTVVTVPASVLAVPCEANLKRAVGAGPVTIAAGAGMTNEQAATPNIAGEGKVVTIAIESASTFSLIGSLSA